jgi:hypothetical protein
MLEVRSWTRVEVNSDAVLSETVRDLTIDCLVLVQDSGQAAVSQNELQRIRSCVKSLPPRIN